MKTDLEFLAILDTSIAKQLFAEPEISAYVANFTDRNKAALLHANGIVETTSVDDAIKMIQLVSAFGRKDVTRIEELIAQGVPVGVRLDYFLPLYIEERQNGEDIFVAATKNMLGGSITTDVNLAEGALKHHSSVNSTTNYSIAELRELENYVNSAFQIRHLLQNAPNKKITQPTPEALEYLIANSATYRDSNQNPVIVFIPGACCIQNRSVSSLIQACIENGANIDSTGFFGVPGIVWSIIMGDSDAVKTFLKLNASITITDDMGNQNLIAWAYATLAAVDNPSPYFNRLKKIIKLIEAYCPDNNASNYVGRTPSSYFNLEACVFGRSGFFQCDDKISVEKKVKQCNSSSL